MATIIDRGGDSDSGGTAALAVLVAAIALVIALFAFGTFSPQKPGATLKIETPSVSTPAPAPAAPTH